MLKVPYTSITLQIAQRAQGGEQIILTRNGQDYAALGPLPSVVQGLKTSTWNSVTLQEVTRSHNGEHIILTNVNHKAALCIMGPLSDIVVVVPPTPVPDPTPVPVPDPTPVPPPPPTFTFETLSVTGQDIITDHDAVTVTVTVPQTGDHLRLFNVKGNGNTVVTILMTGGPNTEWFARYPDTDAGGHRWVDNHASGDDFVLYGCSDAIQWGAAAPTPAPTPTPTPDPIPAPTPVPPAPPPDDPTLHIETHEDGSVTYTLGTESPAPPADGSVSATHHLGAYSIGSFNLPNHWYNAAWTDRTKCPVQIVKSPAQLVAARRAFPYGNTGIKLSGPPARKNYVLMGPAWITQYMPTTGERQDIGLFSDASAYFMMGVDAVQFIDGALAAESVPFRFRDPKDNHMVDLTDPANLHANVYDQPGYQGSPWYPKGPDDGSHPYGLFGGNWTPDTAHMCEMSYAAHMATLDMGFLRSLQYRANFNMLACGGDSDKYGFRVASAQQRGLAWLLRDLFMAHVATQDAEASGTLASDLRPSAYWKQLLNNQLAKMTTDYINSTDPTQPTFHVMGSANNFGPWQQDYMLVALAFGVLTGHSDWTNLYLWSLKNIIDRFSNKSGWPSAWSNYYTNCYAWKQNADGSWDTSQYDFSKPLNWKTAFDFLQNDPNPGARPTAAQVAALAADPTNGGVMIGSVGYLLGSRMALVQAKYLENIGLVNVSAKYPDLDKCLALAETFLKNYNMMAARHSVVLDPAQA